MLNISTTVQTAAMRQTPRSTERILFFFFVLLLLLKYYYTTVSEK